MKINDILSPQGVTVELTGQSKKQVMQELATFAEETFDFEKGRIFEALNNREKIGCTAVGDGVAIPRSKIEDSDQCHLLVAKLAQPVDFDAEDEKPVDLVFCLLGCSEANFDPVKVMPKLSRFAKDEALCAALRRANSAQEIYDLLTQDFQLSKAA